MKKSTIKQMSYIECKNALNQDLSAKKVKQINKRLKKIQWGKRTNIPLSCSGHGDWGGPRGCSVPTVLDVMNALNSIEDKNLILTWEGSTSDGKFTDWGDLVNITLIEVDEDAVAHGDSNYVCNQVVMEVSSNV